MAKVTIVIEDVEGDESNDEGNVSITFSTEPELKEGDPELLSHLVAMQFHNMVENMKQQSEEKETE